MNKYIYGERALNFMKDMDYERVAGLPGEKRGADTIVKHLSDMGAVSRTEEFEIDRYEIQTAKLVTYSPERCEYTVTGYGLSGNTAPEGLRAPFLYADNACDILLSQAKGKIILVNDHPTKLIYKKMSDAGVVGFITVSGLVTDDPGKTDLELRALRKISHRNGQLSNENVRVIPGVTIRANDAVALIESCPDEAEITLIQTEVKAVSRNVITEIQGTDKKDEWIVFGAHYDTVPFSHGMYDNASGSSCILEAYRYFSENPPLRSLRFIWFGTEEQGFRGGSYHLEANPEEKDSVKLMINMDLGGQVIGNYFAVVTAEQKLCSILEFIAQEVGFGLTVKHDIYSSDSEAYADNGIPAVSFLRAGTIGHSRYDTLDLISARVLDESIRFMLLFSEKLINSEVFPVSKVIPDNLKEKLDGFWGRVPVDV